MGPVGRVPPTLQDVGTKAIWSPQLLELTVFFAFFSRTGYGNTVKHARRSVDISTEKQSVNVTCRCLCRVHGDDRETGGRVVPQLLDFGCAYHYYCHYYMLGQKTDHF